MQIPASILTRLVMAVLFLTGCATPPAAPTAQVTASPAPTVTPAPTPFPKPHTVTPTPAGSLVNQSQDLVGLWQVDNPHWEPAYMIIREDGTYTWSPHPDGSSPSQSGKFWFEGAVFHILNDFCGKPGTYEVRRHDAVGQPATLSFTMLEDDCSAEVRILTKRPARRVDPSSLSIPNAEAIAFTADDGVQISGALFGQGRTAIVLAHMIVGGQTSWHPFAQTLAEQGYSALAFDFRGYGKSKGSATQSLFDNDLRAAIAFLRERGFEQIVCIGASIGGNICGQVAHEPGLAGFVIISGPLLALEETDFADLTYPKLFIVSEKDVMLNVNFAIDVQHMYDWSAAPKDIRIFSGSSHGIGLLDSAHGDEVRSLIISFLASIP